MPYPERHWLLTVHWNTPGEQAQFGLRFEHADVAPTQADVLSAANAVSTFWAAGTSDIPPSHVLTFLRLAQIDTNGKYVAGTIAVDHIYSPQVAGTGSGGNIWPLQVSHVASLLTAMPRGIAHKGRVYLPPFSTGLLGTALWPTATVSSRINTFAAMLSTLDGSQLGQLMVYSKGTVAVPAGGKNAVTGTQADSRPDVQRRRAKSQVGALSVVGTVS